MTAQEAKSLADERIHEAEEANALYKEVQDQIQMSANRGSYGTRITRRNCSFSAIKSATEALRDVDGFDCRYSYEDGSATIIVSWENVEEVV